MTTKNEDTPYMEVSYIQDVLACSLHEWADRKISDARFYSRVQGQLEQLDDLRKRMKDANK